MVNEDSNTAPGFTLHRLDHRIRLLLPLMTAAAIEAEVRLVADEEEAVAEAAKAAAAAESAAAAAEQKTKPSVFPPTKSIRPGPMDVEIFSETSIETFLDNVDVMDSANRRVANKVYVNLTNDRGRYRTVPSINPADLVALAAQFENMAEPIKYLSGEIELMAHLPPGDFRLAPMLFLGGPGIGKTAFANALSKVLKLPFSKVRG